MNVADHMTQQQIDTMPDCLRAAFSRVRFQVVATLDNGKEVICNCISQETVDRKFAEYLDIQAHHALNGTTFSDGTTIATISIRNV